MCSALEKRIHYLFPPLPILPLFPSLPPISFSLSILLFISPAPQDKIVGIILQFAQAVLYPAKHISFTRSRNKKITEGECRSQACFTALRPVSRTKYWGLRQKQFQTSPQTGIPGTRAARCDSLRIPTPRKSGFCVQMEPEHLFLGVSNVSWARMSLLLVGPASPWALPPQNALRGAEGSSCCDHRQG